MIEPTDIPLPAILDPILDYLYDVLPPGVYDFMIGAAANLLAFGTAAYNVTIYLAGAKPWEWDAQTIIPPLIALLTAYMALLMAWRTISWMVRSTIWVIKWGTILSVLVGGAGYFAGGGANGGGVANGPGVNGGVGFAQMAGAVFDMLRGAGRRATAATGDEDGAKPGRARPAAWESFDAHREWQFEEGAEREGQTNPASEEVQKVIDGIMTQMRDGGIWGMAQGVATSFLPKCDPTRERRTRPRRRAAGAGVADEA
ncbi:hypothetical protein PENSPDRAFT_652414 [Peniophora sp. CONT]|nr:hypothetical protein PENSPDRAFT_652414 [Peniophora sp. CONT]